MKCLMFMIAVLGLGADEKAPGGQPPGNLGGTSFLDRAVDGQTDLQTLLEKESVYHHIRVTQVGYVRQLQFRRRGTHYDESAINLANPLQFELEYYELMFAGFAHQPKPQAVLFVGLGGGTLAMAIHHYFPGTRVDSVELDPDVVQVAKQFFGLVEDDRMRVYVRDGRVQIRRFLKEQNKYDIIFLDAFRGGYIPYHLTTKEFTEDLRRLLTPEGVVVSNLRPGFESYHYQRRTFAAVFPNQWSYGNGGNVIVVADGRPKPPSKELLIASAERLQKEKGFVSFDLPSIVREVRQGDYIRQGEILTDDYAPTDVLRSIPRDG